MCSRIEICFFSFFRYGFLVDFEKSYNEGRRGYDALNDGSQLAEPVEEDWALLASQEYLTMLESAILEESRGMISPGLGGIENRLRYFLLISSNTGESFTKDQEELIEEKFDLVFQEYDCKIEAADFAKNYATMKILVPLDVAVGNVIEHGLDECNKMDHFLSSTHYVTNVKKPSKQELLELIREISE